MYPSIVPLIAAMLRIPSMAAMVAVLAPSMAAKAVLYVPSVTHSIVVMPVVPSMVAMVAMLRLCSRLQSDCMHTSEGMNA